MAEVLERSTDQHLRLELEMQQGLKEERIKDIKKKDKFPGTCLPYIHHKDDVSSTTWRLGSQATRTFEDIAWGSLKHTRNELEHKWAATKQDREYLGLKGKPLKESQTIRGVPIDENRRLKPTNKLARLLVDAARLFEAITTYQDQQVLENFLYNDPPVHARRSLDQAYIWKLRTTRRRDRDQVVYRFTKHGFPHKFEFNPEPKPHFQFWKRKKAFEELETDVNEAKDRSEKKSLATEPDQKKLSTAHSRLRVSGLQLKESLDSVAPNNHATSTAPSPQKSSSPKDTNTTEQSKIPICATCRENVDNMRGWQWVGLDKYEGTNRFMEGHTKYEDEHGCKHCREEICKVPRAIMVDQLWMWILDKNTILTCFPRRYGVGRKDPSGVFESINRRLKDPFSSANHILSVFDLGLIILEECFNTFFDRAATLDKRPQTLDIFAESIGDVVCCVLSHIAPDLLQDLD
jgi:hypothetical protein